MVELCPCKAGDYLPSPSQSRGSIGSAGARKQIKHRSGNYSYLPRGGPGNIMMGMSCSITALQKPAAIGIQRPLLRAPGRRRRKTTQQQKNKREIYLKKKQTTKSTASSDDTAATQLHQSPAVCRCRLLFFLPQKSRF